MEVRLDSALPVDGYATRHNRVVPLDYPRAEIGRTGGTALNLPNANDAMVLPRVVLTVKMDPLTPATRQWKFAHSPLRIKPDFRSCAKFAEP